MEITKKIQVFSPFVVAMTLLFSSCTSLDSVEPITQTAQSEVGTNVVYDENVEAFAKALASSMSKQEVREFIKSEALKKFDGDYDVLYRKISNQVLNGKSVDNILNQASFSGRTSSKVMPVASLVEAMPLLNISVPKKINNWDVANYEPLVVVEPLVKNEHELKVIKAYDKDGNIHWIDAQKEPDLPVVVVGYNERVTVSAEGKVELKSGLISDVKSNYVQAPSDDEGTGGGGGNTGGTGGSISQYNDNAWIYLKGMSSSDISLYESWWKGAPEITMQVFAPSSTTNFSSLGKIRQIDEMQDGDRSGINDGNWWTTSHTVTYWESAVIGKTLLFHFYEVDGGIPEITISLGGSFKFTLAGVEMSETLGVSTKISDSDDEIGSILVNQTVAPPISGYYDVGTAFNIKLGN